MEIEYALGLSALAGASLALVTEYVKNIRNKNENKELYNEREEIFKDRKKIINEGNELNEKFDTLLKIAKRKFSPNQINLNQLDKTNKLNRMLIQYEQGNYGFPRPMRLK